MVEETDFLFEKMGMFLEGVPGGDVLLFDPLDVVEIVFAVGEYLGGVVEVDSNHVVAEDVPDAVLGGIVHPLLHRDVVVLLLHDRLTRGSLVEVVLVAVLEHFVTVCATDVLCRRLCDGVCAIRGQELFLALLTDVLACPKVVVRVKLAVVAQLPIFLGC